MLATDPRRFTVRTLEKRVASGGTAYAPRCVVSTRQRRKHTVASQQKLTRHGFGHTFSNAASRIADFAGRPWAFMIALFVLLVWAITGPIFGFSDTWQLVINTGTTIVTFLMVFLIQNTQNRDARAIHLKLDELLRATPNARNEFMDAEEEDLDEIEREKAIVDKDDPAPAKERAGGRTIREGHRGNGKS
jgi:low affinity Fe/Cu permease